jgi:hypothetical protein
MDESTKEQHPSFGQIGISRVTSSGLQTFYGSHLRHSNYIEMEIKESTLIRSLNSDRYFDGKNVVRVRMTEAQFAQMITSLNMGGGTPVTITRRENRSVEEPTFRDEREQIHNDFQKKVEVASTSLTEALKRLQTMAAPGAKITKADLQEALAGVEKGVREITSNIPDIANEFEVTTEKIVADAKADIEAHMMNAIRRAKVLGVEASKDEFGVQMMIEGTVEK